jgi:hypothetical protein
MKQLLVILLVAAACFAQKQQTSPPAPHKQVACGTSKGCATFNEMLRNDDPELLRIKHRGNGRFTTLVCFAEEKDADSFFLVQFDRQQDLIWEKDTADPTKEHSPDGLFLLDEYQGGMRNFVANEWLDWQRPIQRSRPEDTLGSATLLTKKEGTFVSIDQAEVDYETTLTNANDQKVGYALRIRLSTKRFQETAKMSSTSLTQSGRCVTF